MTEKWHELRAGNIGGSDIAALFGESPYTTSYQLYHERKGNIPRANLDDNERVQSGKFLEGGVIAWANSKWGTRFEQPRVYVQSKSVPGMGCTPDAFDMASEITVYVDENSWEKNKQIVAIAQIKMVDGLQFAREWEYEGEFITQAPLHILLQCHHEMACTGAGENWLIVCVGGNRLYHVIVERDDEIVQMIEARVTNWWKAFHADIEPAPDFHRDGDWIKKMRDKMPIAEAVDLTGDDELATMIKKLKDELYKCKSAEDEYTFLKAKLVYLYGDTKRLRCGDDVIAFNTNKKGHLRITIGTEKVDI